MIWLPVVQPQPIAMDSFNHSAIADLDRIAKLATGLLQAAADKLEAAHETAWDIYFLETGRAYAQYDQQCEAAEATDGRQWEAAHAKWKVGNAKSTAAYTRAKQVAADRRSATRANAREHLESVLTGAALKRDDALEIADAVYAGEAQRARQSVMFFAL